MKKALLMFIAILACSPKVYSSSNSKQKKEDESKNSKHSDELKKVLELDVKTLSIAYKQPIAKIGNHRVGVKKFKDFAITECSVYENLGFLGGKLLLFKVQTKLDDKALKDSCHENQDYLDEQIIIRFKDFAAYKPERALFLFGDSLKYLKEIPLTY